MITNLKFFKTPSNPEKYLTFLRARQTEARIALSEKCVTLEDSGFKRLVSQRHKIDREVNRVQKIVTYMKNKG
tara:strand:+ start:660 stop:878 length:219 start_codon:yes stop_codon:yes gene_type:complete